MLCLILSICSLWYVKTKCNENKNQKDLLLKLSYYAVFTLKLLIHCSFNSISIVSLKRQISWNSSLKKRIFSGHETYIKFIKVVQNDEQHSTTRLKDDKALKN